MINISALTPGVNVPSSRFRVRQYIPLLKDLGINIKEYPAKIDFNTKLPGILGKVRQRYIFPISLAWLGLKALSRTNEIIKSNRFDAVWLNSIIVNPLFLEKFITRPLIYDVDDAIWINNEKVIRKIGSKANIIIAGNKYIAEWFSKINRNIVVAPTAVDTDRFCPNPEGYKNKKFIIGWTGSGDGLRFVYEIEEHLNVFIRRHQNCYIKIISDKKPDFKYILPERTIYVPWSPILENKELQEVSVGIMPLSDSDWSRGKCSFKMLQYMSTAIPVIVSDLGMNSEILARSEVGYGIRKPGEWIDALESLWQDQSLCIKMGKSGRAMVEREYSTTVIAEQLAVVLKKIV
jgi:glycosyltransferase involved in cell wall biosynthesis